MLFSGMVRKDTWVARDVWMGVPMRAAVLCACAVRVCGSACDGAAPATVRDVDQALAVAATIRTTAQACSVHLRIVFASGHAQIGTFMRMSCA